MTNFEFFLNLDCNKFNRSGGRYSFLFEDRKGHTYKATTNENFIWDYITDAKYYVVDKGPRPTGWSATDCRKWLEKNGSRIW